MQTITPDELARLDAILCSIAGRLGIHPCMVAELRYGEPPATGADAEAAFQRNLDGEDEEVTELLVDRGWIPETVAEWLNLRYQPTRVRMESEFCASPVFFPGPDDDPGIRTLLDDQLVSATFDFDRWWLTTACGDTLEEALAAKVDGPHRKRRDEACPPETWLDPLLVASLR
ncbi:MAG: hypothetical protein AB7S38_18325 [Vulcanimicrobiota bacterium]